MKYILYFLILTFISCKTVNNFYQGRVTDEHGKPLDGVSVTEHKMNHQTTTDKNGYFKLNRSPDWLGKLIFSKLGYKNDTIPSVWHQSGEIINYDFIEKDTTVVIMKTNKSTEKLDLTITQLTSSLKTGVLESRKICCFNLIFNKYFRC